MSFNFFDLLFPICHQRLPVPPILPTDRHLCIANVCICRQVCVVAVFSAAAAGSGTDAASNSWLLGDAARRHVVVKELPTGASFLSVNSVDVLDNCLVCGTDAEQICVMRNLAIV